MVTDETRPEAWRVFDLDVLEGRYDLKGYTPADRKAQAKGCLALPSARHS